MKKNNQSQAENLRQKAEELLKNIQSKVSSEFSEAEMHKLIHELVVVNKPLVSCLAYLD